MITSINIDNFKSLTDFHMSMSKFTVLIGMNGAGKTTILQAFDFMSQLMVGHIDLWLQNRNWSAADLGSQIRPGQNIGFIVDSSHPHESGGFGTKWLIHFNRKDLASRSETVSVGPLNSEGITQSTLAMFFVSNGHYTGKNGDLNTINFSYQGSILSQLLDKELPLELRTLRDAMRNIRSLELLSPHLMHQKARGTADDIGFGGEKLSAFVSSIKGEQKEALVQLLKAFYPRLTDIKASSTKGGWKKLSIIEEFDGKRIETEARHINDGLLRILAILVQSKTDRSLLIFDEIENGVNPELVEKLVNTLVACDQQIIVTTHSPMILNYLDDETARDAVQFVYKTPEGFTRVRRFFDIPRINQKLAVMGAGEAFVDTDLVALEQECIALDAMEANTIHPMTTAQLMAQIKVASKRP